jgi:hypothetical protein
MTANTVNAVSQPDLENEIRDAYNAMGLVTLSADHLTGDPDDLDRLLSAVWHAADKIEALRDAWREGRYGAEA